MCPFYLQNGIKQTSLESIEYHILLGIEPVNVEKKSTTIATIYLITFAKFWFLYLMVYTHISHKEQLNQVMVKPRRICNSSASKLNHFKILKITIQNSIRFKINVELLTRKLGTVEIPILVNFGELCKSYHEIKRQSLNTI